MKKKKTMKKKKEKVELESHFLRSKSIDTSHEDIHKRSFFSISSFITA